ncbi:MAG: hypothetical protein ACI9HJ_001970 [Ulvibacter sp.]|jgi:hypothetical protein
MKKIITVIAIFVTTMLISINSYSEGVKYPNLGDFIGDIVDIAIDNKDNPQNARLEVIAMTEMTTFEKVEQEYAAFESAVEKKNEAELEKYYKTNLPELLEIYKLYEETEYAVILNAIEDELFGEDDEDGDDGEDDEDED